MENGEESDQHQNQQTSHLLETYVDFPLFTIFLLNRMIFLNVFGNFEWNFPSS